MDRSDAFVSEVALVVGAGGPTGGPFIWSALHALEERTGWAPAMASTIVGTSAGAFVAARMGERVDADRDAVDRLATLANAQTLRQGLRTRAAGRIRVVAGRLVAAIAPMSRPFAEYTVPEGPYHEGAAAVTVQRRSGRRYRHELREVADPTAVVRASAAIPGLNQPVEVNGVPHVDGAVHSANNVDLIDTDAHRVVVVVSPMIPATGGSLVSRFHRAQLRKELEPWTRDGRSAVVIMPSEAAHAERRDRERYEPEGARAVERLFG